jgi:5-formyltetrahydrofolate cyclo-ligase
MSQPIPGKPHLRHAALARRDALDEALRQEGAHALAAQFADRLQAPIISGYHAIGSELDPAPLMQALGSRGVALALPVLLDANTMVFRAWDTARPLVSAGFGTLGPDEGQREVLPDLVLAPLAGFSASGQRIGYGKGHYDRALAKMHAKGHRPALLGLAFDDQEVPPFAVEPHDIALDGVLTPSGLRIFADGDTRLAPFLRASEQT